MLHPIKLPRLSQLIPFLLCFLLAGLLAFAGACEKAKDQTAHTTQGIESSNPENGPSVAEKDQDIHTTQIAEPSDSEIASSVAEKDQDMHTTQGVELSGAENAPSVTMLLIQGRSDGDHNILLQAIMLPSFELTPPSLSLEAPSFARNNWPPYGPFPPALTLTHDGHGAFAVAGKADDGEFFIRVFPSLSSTPIKIPIGDVSPVALFLHGRTLFVGAFGQVGWVDLGAETPTYTALVTRTNYAHKPYDLFARSGAHVLAIDDMVRPFFADLFILDAHGNPKHLSDMELPPLLNGHYTKALLLPGPKDDEHILYLLAQFSVRPGSGHNLNALPISQGKLPPNSPVHHPTRPQSLLIPQGKPDEAPAYYTIAEFVPRMEGEPRLLAGTEFTPWTGLATTGTGAYIWVAAGSRGLFRLNAPITSESRPVVMDLGAPCLDVMAVGDDLYALLGGPTPSVAHLASIDGEWKVVAQVSLEAPVTRFVQ